MALDSWLYKVRSALSSSKPAKPPPPPTKLTILAFEVATLMSRLLHLHHSLSDPHLSLLHLHAFHHPGILHLVSPDPHSLRRLFSSELANSLRLAADAVVGTLSFRCSDPALRDFRRLLSDFADNGSDPNRWALSWKGLQAKVVRKVERLVSHTIALYGKMDEVAEKEQVLKKILINGGRQHYHFAVSELHHKIEWLRHEVGRLKDSSLWNRSFDSVTALLVRVVFSLLARIKQVFHSPGESPSAVCPSEEVADSARKLAGFFESAAMGVAAPPDSLGQSGLALRYANIIVVIEKMVKSPRSIGADARDDLYSLLPATIRAALRARLKGVAPAAADKELASKWREALGRILEWLSPLAWNTVRWWSDRSFEKRGGTGGSSSGGVMVAETLQFADRGKAEAAVAELLVGLNYVWRFEMERCVGVN